MKEMGSSGDVLLVHYEYSTVVEAIGKTYLNPVDHILCEGDENTVLKILISIYGTTEGARCGRPTRLRITHVWRHFPSLPQSSR